jgi:hypothetical protein
MRLTRDEERKSSTMEAVRRSQAGQLKANIRIQGTRSSTVNLKPDSKGKRY